MKTVKFYLLRRPTIEVASCYLDELPRVPIIGDSLVIDDGGSEMGTFGRNNDGPGGLPGTSVRVMKVVLGYMVPLNGPRLVSGDDAIRVYLGLD